jgi:hypothetical protein
MINLTYRNIRYLKNVDTYPMLKLLSSHRLYLIWTGLHILNPHICLYMSVGAFLLQVRAEILCDWFLPCPFQFIIHNHATIQFHIIQQLLKRR